MFGFGQKFNADRDVPDLSGRVVLVTGGNNGLGKESARKFAKHNAKVYMGARSEQKANEAIAEIKKTVPNADIVFLELNLASFDSIKKAVQQFVGENDRLDILMNNAGIMATPPGLTKDGYEIQFGTNHVGHALLTRLLTPLLEKTAAAANSDVRVINLTSIGHEWFVPSSGLLLEDAKTDMDSLGPWGRYGHSKLANIYFTKGLAKHHPQIKSVAIHPGGVNTGLGDGVTSLGSKLFLVYIVTGANTGVGKELAHILYSKNAKVYVAARSKEKAIDAINEIKERAPQSKGQLVFLQLDLADLRTIKASAEEFLSQETRLHVLFNNAGVMTPPQGSKTAQGYEPQLGVNCVGSFMFTKLLTPALVATAKAEPRGTVRVVWVSSSAAEVASPTGGLELDNLDYHSERYALTKYGVSKAGSYLYSTEFAKRHRGDGIVSMALNPGNLDSELFRSQGYIVGRFLKLFVLHPAVYGAYTELFAGLSPEVTLEKSGGWVVPWGRFDSIRDDLVVSSKSKAEGGTGIAEEFWKWSEEQIKPYL
ncbi:hypothetical protein DL766_003119 [Monosporascus sp. MC13-8B]|uniref:Oxidoreductase n=1 Tax=Monosporascus cannonballus TaxID=155416 RepID=A0ABY0H5Y8_9PEZI|nr:hypothetical protein DL762_006680 [Monosporascus cannonballus]RYO94516.1 hypothetical protein DL763_004023 [Monosporascus cannonballus]RYP34131.1 hypothetical protein DL766_003119 [Monosporascus sp. MC13-8B]